MVLAFRIKARTSAFLRERLRTDGRIHFTPSISTTVSMRVNSERPQDYMRAKYEPYEQVWLFFNNLMESMYDDMVERIIEQNGPIVMNVIDLGILQSYRVEDDSLTSSIEQGLIVERPTGGYQEALEQVEEANETIKQMDKVIAKASGQELFLREYYKAIA